MSVFSKPAIHENFFCQHCHALLPYGTKQCKYCLKEIDEEHAKINAFINFQLTQASSHANIISTSDPAIIFFVFGALVTRLFKREFYVEIPSIWPFIEITFSLFWFLPVAAIIFWFYRYGKWKMIDDEEYQSKRQSMRLSLRMWLAAYVFHIILLIAVK